MILRQNWGREPCDKKNTMGQAPTIGQAKTGPDVREILVKLKIPGSEGEKKASGLRGGKRRSSGKNEGEMKCSGGGTGMKGALIKEGRKVPRSLRQSIF